MLKQCGRTVAMRPLGLAALIAATSIVLPAEMQLQEVDGLWQRQQDVEVEGIPADEIFAAVESAWRARNDDHVMAKSVGDFLPDDPEFEDLDQARHTLAARACTREDVWTDNRICFDLAVQAMDGGFHVTFESLERESWNGGRFPSALTFEQISRSRPSWWNQTEVGRYEAVLDSVVSGILARIDGLRDEGESADEIDEGPSWSAPKLYAITLAMLLLPALGLRVVGNRRGHEPFRGAGRTAAYGFLVALIVSLAFAFGGYRAGKAAEIVGYSGGRVGVAVADDEMVRLAERAYGQDSSIARAMRDSNERRKLGRSSWVCAGIGLLFAAVYLAREGVRVGRPPQ